MQAWNWDTTQAQAAAAASYAAGQGYAGVGMPVVPNMAQPQMGYQQFYGGAVPAVAPELAQQQLEAQQQHWQQWQTWQQQYQQWQSEYGDKYQASMNSMLPIGSAGGAPTVVPPPSVAQPPPLPPPDKPPPPPEDPYQGQKRQPEDTAYQADASKKPRNENWDNRRGAAGRGGRWEPERVPTETKETPDELSEAEKAFDLQFKQWEEQFTEWKAQNINHPDKNQYREYESKWRDWREKLLQRRVQMRKKRESSMAKTPNDSPARSREERFDQSDDHQLASFPLSKEPEKKPTSFGFQPEKDGGAMTNSPKKPEIKSLMDLPLAFMAPQANALLNRSENKGNEQGDKNRQQSPKSFQQGNYGPQKTGVNGSQQSPSGFQQGNFHQQKSGDKNQSGTFNQGGFMQQDQGGLIGPQLPPANYQEGNFAGKATENQFGGPQQANKNKFNQSQQGGNINNFAPVKQNVLNFPKTFQLSQDTCKVLEGNQKAPQSGKSGREGAKKEPDANVTIVDIAEDDDKPANYDFLKKSTDGIPGLDLFSDKPLFGDDKGSDTPNSNSQNSSLKFGQDSSISQDNISLGPGIQTSQGQAFQFPKMPEQKPDIQDKAPEPENFYDDIAMDDVPLKFGKNQNPLAQKPMSNQTPGNVPSGIPPYDKNLVNASGTMSKSGPSPANAAGNMPGFGGVNPALMPGLGMHPMPGGQNVPGNVSGFGMHPMPGGQNVPGNMAGFVGPGPQPFGPGNQLPVDGGFPPSVFNNDRRGGFPEPRHFGVGNQAPNFALGNQAPNFPLGNQAPNFPSGNLGSNVGSGNQTSNLGPGNQGLNFGHGNQGQNFMLGNQVPPSFGHSNQGMNMGPRNQNPNFAPGNQNPNFAHGNQNSNFAPGNQGQGMGPRGQNPNFVGGNQNQNFGPGNQSQNMGPRGQAPNFPGNQGSNFGHMDQGNKNNQGFGNHPPLKNQNQTNLPGQGFGRGGFDSQAKGNAGNDSRPGWNQGPQRDNFQGQGRGDDNFPGSNNSFQALGNSGQRDNFPSGPRDNFQQGPKNSFSLEGGQNFPHGPKDNFSSGPKENYPRPLMDSFPLGPKENLPTGPKENLPRVMVDNFPLGGKDNFPRGPQDNFLQGSKNTPLGQDSFSRGPNENFPRGSGDNFGHGSNDNFPRGPNDNFPRGPNDSFPRGPNDSFPRGQNDSFPRGQNDSFPRGPNDSFPRGPNDNFPRGPNDSFPRGPNDNFPRGPNDSFPRGPNDSFPRGPNDSFPRGLNDSFPRGPNDSFPRGLNDSFPRGPNDSFSPGATKDITHSSRDNFPTKDDFSHDSRDEFLDDFPPPQRDGFTPGPKDNFPLDSRKNFLQDTRENFPPGKDGFAPLRDGFPGGPSDFPRDQFDRHTGEGRGNYGSPRDYERDRGYDDIPYGRDRERDYRDADRGFRGGWDQQDGRMSGRRGQFDDRDEEYYRSQRLRPWERETPFELEPATIVEYGHKPPSSVIPALDTVVPAAAKFLTPVQTFEYGHGTPTVRHPRAPSPPSSDQWRRSGSGGGADDGYYGSGGGRREREDRDRDGRGSNRWESRDRDRDDRLPSDKYEHEGDRYRSAGRDEPRGGVRRDGDRERDGRGSRYRDARRDDSSSNRASTKSVPLAPPPPTFSSPAKRDSSGTSSSAQGSGATSSQQPMLIEDLLSPPGRDTRPPRIVIILRGVPGSGKTFVAKLIKDREMEAGGSAPRILCLDDYFMTEVEKEEIEPETGRKVKVKVMEYEYEQEMEKHYRSSLIKAFRKTVIDNYFPFIIVDCVNQEMKHFDDIWSFAKQKGFQVYMCEMDNDLSTCARRNVHGRTEKDIAAMIKHWPQVPSYYLKLDVRSLLQSAAITDVEMEDTVPEGDDDVVEVPDNEKKEEGDEEVDNISKWERMEAPSGDKLDRMDGLKRKKGDEPATMEDWLTPDDDYEKRTSLPGKRRVRWADLEEKRSQEKLRAIGFVVGQTDWSRMTDPTCGESALTQTKYI